MPAPKPHPRHDSRRDPRQDSRRRSSPPPPAPLLPLRQIIASVERELRKTEGKPTRNAVRDAWRLEDGKQGERPDYLLWRHTMCRESPPDKRRDVIDLALKTLRANTPHIHWAGLCLSLPLLLSDTPSLRPRPEQTAALIAAVGSLLATLREPLAGSEHSSTLAKWLASVALDAAQSRLTVASATQHLQALQSALSAASPEWRPMRDLDLSFITTEPLYTEPASAIIRSLVSSLHTLLAVFQNDAQSAGFAPSHDAALRDLAQWQHSAWRFLASARPASSPPRKEELSALLDAAQSARLSGDTFDAARLAALALHLMPQGTSNTQHRTSNIEGGEGGRSNELRAAGQGTPPPSMLKVGRSMSDVPSDRFRPAAWPIAEAGLELPERLRVRLDELPFPGEPPQTALGLEATRLFADEADVSRQRLLLEVAQLPAWQQLREAGLALHHPLAALAWMAKKAQSFALKKSPGLIATAARLALQHGCLTSAGRLIQEQPSADLVLTFAKAMRESVRRMPVLRDARAWQQWATSLRLAWGKLEADAISEDETLFLLHETLLDRPSTALRSLPPDLRILALRHAHSRRSPSPLILALADDPSLMRSLEHQRALEHWSLASDARSKPDLARTAWVSVVTRGDPTAGKYSLLAIGPAGQISRRDRIAVPAGGSDAERHTALAQRIAEATAQVAPEADWLLLGLDSDLSAAPWSRLIRSAGSQAIPCLIPSWEWASRVLRETRSDAPIAAEILIAEGSASSVDTALHTSAATLAERQLQVCILLAEAPSSAATKWTPLLASNSPPLPENGAPNADHRPALRRSTHIGQHALVVAHSPCTDLARSCLAQGSRLIIDAREPLPKDSVLALHQALATNSAVLRAALLSDERLAGVTLHGLPT